jgi:hypothetical protein
MWILPERTATRTIGQLLNFWEVEIYEGEQFKKCVPQKNLEGSFSQGLRHEWKGTDLYSDYNIILNVRNPYTRMKSYYYSLFLKNDCAANNDCHLKFGEFVDKFCRISGGLLDHFTFEQIYEIKPPIHVVKYENLKQDLLRIPFISQKLSESNDFREEWNRVIENNIFDKETKGSSYEYLESDAEKIYNLFKRQFELFGYEENSWRYL